MHAGRLLSERYEILHLIAEGGSGEVWEALDRATNIHVAVKAISLDRHGWRCEVRDRFLQEAKLLRLIAHENLVGLRDVGETDDGYLFTVLELLQGETLAARIARAPRLLWQEAREIALALARGVGALHEKAIIHRDLKPGNAVLHQADERVVPKLIDLGISKVRAAADPAFRATLTATGQVLGTPQYMSYEQALGDRAVDVRTDVWSLGVVLYEMLAGRPPFQAPNVNAVLAAIRNEQPPPLASLAPDAPDALVRIAMRCLARDPDARYRDGAALAGALVDMCVGEPEAVASIDSVVASPTSAPEMPRGLRPHRLWPAAIGGALLVMVIGAVALSLIPARERAASETSPPTPPQASAALVSSAVPASEPAAASSAVAAPSNGAMAPPSGISPPKAPSARSRPVTKIDSAGF